MEIIKMIALALSAILLLCSCSSSNAYSLEYQEHPLKALIAFERNGVFVSALLSILPKTMPNGTVVRDITLNFRSPDSLAGIKIERVSGNVSVSCGTLIVSDSDANAWLQIADFFNIDGTVKRSYISKLQGQSYNCIEALGDDGKEYTIYLHENGEPRRICSDGLTVDILSFESAR